MRSTNTSDKEIDFVLVTTLQEELEAVIGVFKLQGPRSKKNVLYHYGKLGGYTVIGVKCVDRGNPSSTALTKDIITLWKPRYVILLGIAGGVIRRDDVNVGDVVVSSDAKYYAYEKITEGERKPREPPIAQPSPLLRGIAENVKAGWQRKINEPRPDGKECTESKAIHGQILSGETIWSDYKNKDLQNLLKRHDKAIAFETETGGVAKAIYESSPSQPVQYIVVRGISDPINMEGSQELREKWRRYAAEAAAAFAYRLITTMADVYGENLKSIDDRPFYKLFASNEDIPPLPPRDDEQLRIGGVTVAVTFAFHFLPRSFEGRVDFSTGPYSPANLRRKLSQILPWVRMFSDILDKQSGIGLRTSQKQELVDSFVQDPEITLEKAKTVVPNTHISAWFQAARNFLGYWDIWDKKLFIDSYPNNIQYMHFEIDPVEIVDAKSSPSGISFDGVVRVLITIYNNGTLTLSFLFTIIHDQVAIRPPYIFNGKEPFIRCQRPLKIDDLIYLTDMDRRVRVRGKNETEGRLQDLAKGTVLQIIKRINGWPDELPLEEAESRLTYGLLGRANTVIDIWQLETVQLEENASLTSKGHIWEIRGVSRLDADWRATRPTVTDSFCFSPLPQVAIFMGEFACLEIDRKPNLNNISFFGFDRPTARAVELLLQQEFMLDIFEHVISQDILAISDAKEGDYPDKARAIWKVRAQLLQCLESFDSIIRCASDINTESFFKTYEKIRGLDIRIPELRTKIEELARTLDGLASHAKVVQPSAITFGTDIPQMIYDVALSFAGEDRSYAKTLANCLKDNGIKVFYDEYERSQLWGKNLFDQLAWIYKDAAKYCVIFVSKHYANQLWTDHERKSAQARAFQERGEYILPVRLDDTEIPGILPTVGYIDLRTSSIQEVCRLVLEKLSLLPKSKRNSQEATPSMVKESPPSFEPSFGREEFDMDGFISDIDALKEVSDSQTRLKLFERIRDKIPSLPYDQMSLDLKEAISLLLPILKNEIGNQNIRGLCLDILHIVNQRRDTEVNAMIKDQFLSWIETNYNSLPVEEKKHALDVWQRLYDYDLQFIKKLLLDSIEKWPRDEFNRLYLDIGFDQLDKGYIYQLKVLLWKLRDEAKKNQLDEKVRRIDKLLELSYFR